MPCFQARKDILNAAGDLSQAQAGSRKLPASPVPIWGLEYMLVLFADWAASLCSFGYAGRTGLEASNCCSKFSNAEVLPVRLCLQQLILLARLAIQSVASVNVELQEKQLYPLQRQCCTGSGWDLIWRSNKIQTCNQSKVHANSRYEILLDADMDIHPHC